MGTIEAGGGICQIKMNVLLLRGWKVLLAMMYVYGSFKAIVMYNNFMMLCYVMMIITQNQNQYLHI